jgi:hypothetical protein
VTQQSRWPEKVFGVVEVMASCINRALAAEAAALDGYPWLLSFSSMAEVLGWPKRPPLVADCDRPRVLASWAQHCQGRVPSQRFIPFAAVRTMSPEEFVHTLATDMKVNGLPVIMDLSAGSF